MVQWLRLCAPNSGGPGSIPDQGTRFPHAATKSLHAATKTQHSQVNKYFKSLYSIVPISVTFSCHSYLNLDKSCPLSDSQSSFLTLFFCGFKSQILSEVWQGIHTFIHVCVHTHTHTHTQTCPFPPSCPEPHTLHIIPGKLVRILFTDAITTKLIPVNTGCITLY